MANMIAYDNDHQEHVFPVESSSLKSGDILLIKTGEQVPADCKVLWGEASVSEAILTGESLPVEKKMNDKLIGGSVVESGTMKAYVTAAGNDTVLNQILKMVNEAQAEKPPVQQLADTISAVFVPAVVSLALLTFFISYFFTSVGAGESLLRSIAVLVILVLVRWGLPHRPPLPLAWEELPGMAYYLEMRAASKCLKILNRLCLTRLEH